MAYYTNPRSVPFFNNFLLGNISAEFPTVSIAFEVEILKWYVHDQ